MNNKLTHVLLTYLPRPIVIFIVLMVEPVYWLIVIGLLGFGSLLLGTWFVGSFLFVPNDRDWETKTNRQAQPSEQ